MVQLENFIYLGTLFYFGILLLNKNHNAFTLISCCDFHITISYECYELLISDLRKLYNSLSIHQIGCRFRFSEGTWICNHQLILFILAASCLTDSENVGFTKYGLRFEVFQKHINTSKCHFLLWFTCGRIISSLLINRAMYCVPNDFWEAIHISTFPDLMDLTAIEHCALNTNSLHRESGSVSQLIERWSGLISPTN